MSFRLAALAGSRATGNEGLGRRWTTSRPSGQSHPEEVRRRSRSSSPTTETVAGWASRARSRRHPSSSPRRGAPRASSTSRWAASRPASTTGARTRWPTSTTSTGIEVYPYPGCRRTTSTPGPRTRRARHGRHPRGHRPGQDWQSQVDGATVSQLAALFAQVVQARRDRRPAARPLPRAVPPQRPAGRAVLLHARADAGPLRRRAGLQRAGPGRAVHPSAWAEPIPEGQDPIGLQGFGPARNQTLSPSAAQACRRCSSRSTRRCRQSLLATAGRARWRSTARTWARRWRRRCRSCAGSTRPPTAACTTGPRVHRSALDTPRPA